MRWLRFTKDGAPGFGTLDGATVAVHRGELFGANEPTGEQLAVGELAWRTPCEPTKLIALLNNSRALPASRARAYARAVATARTALRSLQVM